MREQARKKEGRQASTRKAFSRSHALEGLVFNDRPGREVNSFLENVMDSFLRLP